VVGAGSVPTVRTVDRLETRLLTLDPRAADAVVALILGVITVTLVGLQKHPSVVELLAGVALSATVAGRRQAPVLAIVIAGAGAAGVRPDEIDVIDLVAHPVPDEAQSRQRSLDPLPLCRRLPGHHGVILVRVMAYQRGIDDRDPPHCLADHRERPRLVRCPDPGESVGRIAHRSDGPLERTHPGHRVTHLLAVPRDPAPGRAEPGVLTARRERSSALFALPCIHHCPMLRVTPPGGSDDE